MKMTKKELETKCKAFNKCKEDLEVAKIKIQSYERQMANMTSYIEAQDQVIHQ